ncbi:MAG: hypothetical protein JXA36_02735 [Coriobacteriia bacterium]|nr:hypothetical protein [Coriobacteriia bacterium]
MGLLNSSNIPTEGKRVVKVRVDRIGAAAGKELWWVALGFNDETTKPEGMFTNYDEAASLGTQLADEWHVEVVVTKAV